ncbi:MAG TPA: alkaline phosphatase family protein, partial [Actinomycetota bacterium]|nr:alkaline phosphatase family protein [Actinomycetota bacterium]
EEVGEITLDRPVTVADIAPTFAELLGYDLPADRPGRVITEALVSESERPEPPALVVLVVWDGGGTNVLDRWPDAWPFLRILGTAGAAIQDATVGSSPSVTPSTHATMGTGAFPNQHGIADIPLRNGERVPDSYPDKSPKFLELETLADLFDRDHDNVPKVGMIAERGWHLGMMGHGSFLPRADKDFAIMTQGGDGELTTNPDYYRLPNYMRDIPGLETDEATVDAADGEIDGAWMDHPLPEVHRAGAANPVWTLYQTRLIRQLVDRAGFGRDAVPDLLFTNVKEIDLVGHVYNLINPEMRSQLLHADNALRQLVQHLDATVGANRYVLALTADHGHGPDPRFFDAWPVNMDQVRLDIATRFRVRITELFQAQRPTGLWLRPSALRAHDISIEDIANFLVDYRLEENTKRNQVIPTQYAGRIKERLFAAAFPSARLDEVLACAATR